MSHHYCVVLGETGKGKSSFLNAALKNHGFNQTLDEGWTKSLNSCKPISIDNDKYFFIDTPGLGDKDLDEKTKEALRYQATNQNNRISAILICLHIDDKRFCIECSRNAKGIYELVSFKRFLGTCFNYKDFCSKPDFRRVRKFRGINN